MHTNKSLKTILFTIITFALMSTFTFGSENESDLLFSSIRQQAMGGISTATSESAAALYQNPAGLSNLGGFHLKFPRIRAMLGTEGLEKMQDISDIATEDGDESAQLDMLQALVPMNQIFGFGLYPLVSVSMPGLAAGIYVDSAFSAALTRRTSPTLHVIGQVDASGMIGISDNFDILGEEISIGATFKYISRSKIYNKNTGEMFFELGQGDILANINGLQEDRPDFLSMSGFGVDIGFLKPLEGINGNIGLVIKNIGASLEGEMSLKDDAGNYSTSTVTGEIPVTAKLGFSVDQDFAFIPILGGLLGETTFGIDYEIISDESSMYKKLHMGFEKEILFLKLRGGLNQGYVVGGFGLDLYILHLNYVYNTYEAGEEIGMEPKSFHTLEIGVLF